MNSKIDAYVQSLYGAQSEDTLKRIQGLIAQARRTPSTGDAAPNTPAFSEKDVILITYGDSLKRKGEVPLQTLQHFAKSHLKDSFSAVHILPFYPYSSDDGFSVVDFYAVRDDLGTWEDVEKIGEDFDLMFDAVFNHMSAKSDWFTKFLAAEPEFERLFMIESPETDLSAVVRPRALPLLTPFTRPDGSIVHVWTTFSDDQVDFDARDPLTVIRLLEILLFYVEKGAHIIRLDAIAFLWKIAGTSSIHLEQTHTVIKLMRAVLDEVAPHVILITETNVPHKENISYFGDGTDEAQMVYNFTLPPLLFHTMVSGSTDKLREWMNSLDTPSPRTTFFNFTASHDGIGVRPVEGILNADELAALIAHVEKRGGRVSYRQNSDGTQSPYELNITYVDAVTDPDESEALQARRFLVSQAIAAAVAGVPAVYIHSLLGSHNDLEGMHHTGRNRTINRAKLDFDHLEAVLKKPDTFRNRVFEAYTRMLGIRRAQSAFHPNAAMQAVDLENIAVFGILRTSDKQRILALNNISAETQTVNVAPFGQPQRDLLDGNGFATTEVSLMPYQVMWVEL